MNYKSFAIALIAGIMATGFVACKDTPDESVDTKLTVAPKELSFIADGEAKTVTVTSELDWKATTKDEWLTIVEAEGEFTVTATANETDEARTGSITVDNGQNTATIAVTQAFAADPALEISPKELSFIADGEAKTVTVTSELDWKATTEDEWLTIAETEGEFTVTAAANDGDARTGSITVDNGENTARIAVTQESGIDPALTVSTDELSFIADGEAKTVTVTSELDWNATTETEWLDIAETEGEFTVTATANEGDVRTGSITVSNGTESETKTIAVTQEAGEVVWEDSIPLVYCGPSSTAYYTDYPNTFNALINLCSYNPEDVHTGYELLLKVVMPEIDGSEQYVEIIPETYWFSDSDNPGPYTIGMTYDTTIFQYQNSNNILVAGHGQDVTISEDSFMTVKGDYSGYTIAMEIILSNGETLHFTYEGPIEIVNPLY